MLIEHKQYLPSFGLGFADQFPVCVYTILSVNESVRDCAAYRGVSTDLDKKQAFDKDAMLERIKAGGTKISETEARKYFDEIETMKLRYRR